MDAILGLVLIWLSVQAGIEEGKTMNNTPVEICETVDIERKN